MDVEDHVATVCKAQEDCPLRPPVDVPPGHGVHDASDVAVAPPREKVFEGQGLAFPDDCPSRQKYPAGHTACVDEATLAVAQKWPGAHGFDMDVVLPVAVQ